MDDSIFSPFAGLDGEGALSKSHNPVRMGRAGSPFPDLTKAHHVIGVDDEVVYVPTGHKGKVTNIAHGTYYVTMPTGHAIACSIHDLCPADFPPAERSPTPTGKPDGESALESKMAAILPNAGGLMRALASGLITDHDRALVKRAFDSVKASRGVCDPFGESEGEDERMLKLMADKYANTGEPFTKAAHGLTVGARVRDKSNGRMGKITALGLGGVVHVKFDDGVEGSYTSGHVEPADSFAKRDGGSSAYHPGQAVRISDGRSGTVTRIGEFAPHCIAVTLPSGVLVECLPEDVLAS